MYTDAHFHLADYLECSSSCDDSGAMQELFTLPLSFCCSAHEQDEYERQRRFAESLQKMQKPAACLDKAVPYVRPAVSTNGVSGMRQYAITETRSPKNKQMLFSFGIHPQNPVMDEADLLYHLLETRSIHAVGECGFDLFTDEYKRQLPMQQKIWDIQIQWAHTFQLPIVIHCRKALPLIFNSVPALKKLPAVIFHGWSGSIAEANAFLKKGVNAYFSLGKAVLRGQKSVCAMAAAFDMNRLLTETDAPYMRLKAEAYSRPSDIVAVTAQCVRLRTNDARIGGEKRIANIRQYASCAQAVTGCDRSSEAAQEWLCCIEQNFMCAFGLSV